MRTADVLWPVVAGALGVALWLLSRVLDALAQLNARVAALEGKRVTHD